MPETITFLLPSFNEARYQSAVEEIINTNNSKVNLSRAKKIPFLTARQWLIEQYNLAENYHNSARFMAIGHGLTEPSIKETGYWLRADPIMLTVGHNGLFCRGNRVLNVSQDERQSLQELINQYFARDELELIFVNSTQGYLKTATKPTSTFTPLTEVIGNEISNALPGGEQVAHWHGVLTDLQMLLHNCEVNVKRQENGEQAISGLWLWAESDLTTFSKEDHNSKHKLYTDEPALSGALGKQVNLQEIGKYFEKLPTNSKHIRIYSAELQDACSQDDQQSWLELHQYWYNNWIIPAMKAVDKRDCALVELITDDGFSYQYNTHSRWCFWR